MKVCIAGSRSILDMTLVFDCINQSALQITEVVCGKAIGVDSLGEEWAKRANVHVEAFRPDYETYGPKIAPYKRNEAMAQYCDAAIVVWDGKSRGTKHMVDLLFSNKKPHVMWNHKGVWQYSYRMENTDDDRD